jgi:dephospho-CoA kinase
MILGITGKIGSGKTTVCNMLQQKGAIVIDADKVVQELYQPQRIGALKIKQFFGEEFLYKDGRVNKNKLRKLVWGDSKKLHILSNVIHPIVVHEIKKKIDSIQKSGLKKKGTIIIEAIDFSEKYLKEPLRNVVSSRNSHISSENVESATKTYQERFLKKIIDKLILVTASEKTIKKRLENKMSENEIEKILREQTFNDAYDFVIKNNDSKMELEKQIIKLWHRLQIC